MKSLNELITKLFGDHTTKPQTFYDQFQTRIWLKFARFTESFQFVGFDRKGGKVRNRPNRGVGPAVSVIACTTAARWHSAISLFIVYYHRHISGRE